MLLEERQLESLVQEAIDLKRTAKMMRDDLDEDWSEELNVINNRLAEIEPKIASLQQRVLIYRRH